MQAKDVIERARIILQDAGADYWKTDELPKWLTDARNDAYRMRPDLYQVVENMTLVAGAEQSVPHGSRVLLDVIRNVSAPRARRITPTDDALLSASRPAWRSQAQASEIIHYLYSPAKPGVFDVYPPARAGVTVEVNYAALPAAITTADSTVELEPEGEHAAALVDYILYRAFLKEADTVPAFQARAAQHYAAFQGALAISPTATSPTQG